ncbi:MAG: response regulator [Cytophagales bacterium]|nr:response regulator [Bernardetiaceae bacterium]MDW8210046.1 response regulator [Cytophagales bacterium]
MPKQVLIAEDSSVIQNITRRVLQFQNFDIVAVKNGQQVLDYLENHSCDIILMDISMPIMDGMECATRVRSLPDAKKASIPIVAITGNAKNYTMEDFQKVGINDYIQKPINFDVLVETVRRLTNS